MCYNQVLTLLQIVFNVMWRALHIALQLIEAFFIPLLQKHYMKVMDRSNDILHGLLKMIVTKY